MNDPAEDSLAAVLARFRGSGGEFIRPTDELAGRLGDCRALVFDWDGVFNAGRKGLRTQSDFSEADSMGTNMLRYGLWRQSGRLPVTAIVSGENNDSAVRFAEREHFTAVYTGIRDKRQAIEHLCANEDISPSGIACVFDDINDLPMAGLCGIRLMVRRAASPMFSAYVEQRALCDYVSGAGAGNYAVREVCEMLLGLLQSYDQVLDSRIADDDDYRAYLTRRQAGVTGCFSQHGESIGIRGNEEPVGEIQSVPGRT